MSIFSRLTGTETPAAAPPTGGPREAKAQPLHFQPVQVGAPASVERHVRRLDRLFTWLENKADRADPAKVTEVKAEIKQRAHILAGRGFPFVDTHDRLKEEFDGWLR